MSVLIHDNTKNGHYITRYLVVTGQLNWDNYFERIKYINSYLVSGVSYNLYKIGELNLLAKSSNVIMYVNNLLEKIIPTSFQSIFTVNGNSSYAGFRHLVIFNPTVDITFSKNEETRTIFSNKKVLVKQSRYKDNKLAHGYTYLGFVEYTTGLTSYDLEYYSTHPRHDD
jgi:hypothetical protein